MITLNKKKTVARNLCVLVLVYTVLFRYSYILSKHIIHNYFE